MDILASLIGITLGLPYHGVFPVILTGDLRYGSRWLVVAMISLLLALTPTHLLGPPNPLGAQAFSTSTSQKRHNFCWLDYKYLLQFTTSHYCTPSCSFAGSWRSAIITELISCYQQRQGKQWTLCRPLPSHQACMRGRKMNVLAPEDVQLGNIIRTHTHGCCVCVFKVHSSPSQRLYWYIYFLLPQRCKWEFIKGSAEGLERSC